ncbi:hypothetical protein [Streptomyces sp. NPDC048349]|uniref:hypothetical protein n=1 Tax=Streptomyces sp. NPDC048349 TaxID=3155486 RepID=UPI00341AF58A
MNSRTWNRRIVLAAASVTLIGGGVALPATAMAAPTAPQHSVTLVPHDDGHDPGLQDGDLSVPGVMGGDLMDPHYPQGDQNDNHDTPNGNGGSSLFGGKGGHSDDYDHNPLGGDSGVGDITGHTDSGSHNRHHGKGLDDWHDDMNLAPDSDVDLDDLDLGLDW